MNVYAQDAGRKEAMLPVLRDATAIVALSEALASRCRDFLKSYDVTSEPVYAVIPQSVSIPPELCARANIAGAAISAELASTSSTLTDILGVPAASKIVLLPAGLRPVKRPWALVGPLAAAAAAAAAKQMAGRASAERWRPSPSSPLVMAIVGARLHEPTALRVEACIEAALGGKAGSEAAIAEYAGGSRGKEAPISATHEATDTEARPQAAAGTSAAAVVGEAEGIHAAPSDSKPCLGSSAFRAGLLRPVSREMLLSWMVDDSCTAVCNCSEAEGQSNALLEAMACRKPVVAADIEGNRGVIVHGRTGWLERDDAAIAARLLRICCDDSGISSIVEAATREVVSGRFSAAAEAAGWERVLQQVHDGHAQR